MIKTSNFTSLENIDLMKEISLIAPIDTPFYSLLMSKNLYDTTVSKVTTWRERSLDNTDDISQVEGADTDTFQSSSRAEKNNVCEIFKKAVSISGTAESSGITGINDLFASEINDRLTEMKVVCEKKLITGEKNDGSSNPFIRKMDGLLSFALEENTVRGVTLTETYLKNTIKKLWDAGLGTGNYYCLLNADMKETVDAIFEDKYSYIAQESLFGLVTRTYQSNYGNVTFLLDRHMPSDKLVVFDASYFKVSYLRKPFFEMLGKTGDNTKGQVITEVTLKCLNQKALAVFEMDIVSPELVSATLNTGKKVVTITMSEPIANATADLTALKAKVTVATDGTTFAALGATDGVAITSGKLVVTFNSVLSTSTNKIKVGADAIKDSAGNKNAEITTGAIDAS
ncbi:MAG: DUF5309 domain-containing protein [Dysgonamonadaceae bacterium]|nr:DUF5309 domain-containing protein [Dysgonamonadaceae bacterium]